MRRRSFLASPLVAALLTAAGRIRKRLGMGPMVAWSAPSATMIVTVGKGGDHATLSTAP